MTRALLALLLTGCATLHVDQPTCGVQHRRDGVAYCCEAGVSGELSAGVVSLDVTGLVEGCAVLRVVVQEGEVRR